MIRRNAIYIFLFLPLVLIGCGNYIAQNRQQTYINTHPNLNAEKIQAIRSGELLIGMTKNEVIASWGEPLKINISKYSWGIHEQWIYGYYSRVSRPSYVYFEDGILKAIQY